MTGKNECENNTSCSTYRIFKTCFGFENYLRVVPAKLRKFLIKIRTRNHKLPVDIGRWRRIPIDQRKCHLCDSDIGDEFHYILACKKLKDLRKKYLDSCYLRGPNTLLFCKLMNSKNVLHLKKTVSLHTANFLYAVNSLPPTLNVRLFVKV